MTSGSFDLDALAVSDRFRLFAFTRREDHQNYLWVLRAMDRLRAMHAAQSHTDEIEAMLGELTDATIPSLRERLDYLAEDGVLHRLEDASRAGSLALYRNRQSVYQFTEIGHVAYTAVENVLGTRPKDANLSRLGFSDLVRDLRELAEANKVADGDEIVRRLSSLDRAIEDMARRSARFHLALGDITRSTDASPEMFLTYKHALLAHMNDFMIELDRYLPRLAEGVAAVEATGIEILLVRAAGADDRPLMSREDAREEWRLRWAGIRAWFAGDGSQATGRTRAGELADATRAGVSSVIALLRQITEAQRGGVNRSAQLRHLARWVYETPDADDAHALMGAAFNLRRARHLGGVHDDEEVISPRLAWSQAPGVEIALTMFRRGKSPTPGLPQRINTRAGVRNELRRRQAADREEERAAARRLLEGAAPHADTPHADTRRTDTRRTDTRHTDTPDADTPDAEAGPLGDRVLDETETRVLLKLLTRALEARAVAAGRITGGTGKNDVLIVRLTPADTGTTIRTKDGILHLPGVTLDVEAARG